MPQQQVIQLKQPDGSTLAQQIIQVKPSNSEQTQASFPQQVGQIIQGPNGIFQVLQPVPDAHAQETLLIPNQQPFQQAFITPSGQIIRGPIVTATGNLIPQAGKFKSDLNNLINNGFFWCIPLILIFILSLT